MAPPPRPRWAPGSFLARLPAAQADELLRHGVRRRFSAGHVLLLEGDPGTHVELIQLGFVKITSVVDGLEVLMGIRVAGDIVGELAGLTGRPRMATASACGEVTSTVVAQRDFHRFLRRHPDAAMTTAAVSGERLRWANERRTDFAAFPAYARIARLLAELAITCGWQTEGEPAVELPLSQPELARMAGASPATVQSVLRRLRDQGTIDTGYRHIVVRDVQLLLAAGADLSR